MQKYGSLVIEKKEFVLLKRLLNLTGYYKEDIMRQSVRKLGSELESAKICDETEMPVDVIRFNTMITIVSKNGWQRKFKLVLPGDSDVKNDKVSILTPMGAAVVGYAEGDRLEWEFPSGKQQLTIEKVEQENQYINASMIL